jgi:hypothetical protein
MLESEGAPNLVFLDVPNLGQALNGRKRGECEGPA